MSHCSSQEHTHGNQSYNKAFMIAIVANAVFVVFQIIASFWANSTSLRADALHNLGDVMGLVLAWIAMGLMRRKPSAKASYGFKKTSILAAMANGMLLVFTCGAIASEAVYKLFVPGEINAVSVMIVAGIGIVINGASALLFIKGQNDLNIKAAFLHLFYDALISLGVVFSGALIYWKHWYFVDPIVGLLIALFILKGTWGLFKDSFGLIIDAVPSHISWTKVSEFLLKTPGVNALHDLHIWAISTQENALSVHLYMPDEPLTDERRAELVAQLEHQFNIQHATIQIEKTQLYCEDVCAH